MSIHRISSLLRPWLRNSVRFKSFCYRLLWWLPERWREQTLVRTALKTIARSRKQIRFLNVGANDGLSGDPLREFIILHHWEGILVEPVDFVFNRLKKAYAHVQGVVCVNAAIGNQTGSIPFWYIRRNDVLPPGYDQIGSFSRGQVAKHTDLFPGLDPYITSRDVPCITVCNLLQKHHMPAPDVVLIDTEGYDFEVVKQLDLTQEAPGLIIYEEVHLADSDRQACRELLKQHGYQIESDGFDCIATRNQAK